MHRCSPLVTVVYFSEKFQVQFLREHFGDVDIEVDGGVGPSTIQACAEVLQSSVPFEPCHVKTCFCRMQTTKAQISLRIHAV